MKLQSLDTSPEIEALQLRLMAQVGVEGRLERMRALSASLITLSRQSLMEAHPEWDEQEVLLQWAASTYGESLALQVRRSLHRSMN